MTYSRAAFVRLAFDRFTCRGFTANVQRRAGGDTAREADVMGALKRGVELSFAVDLSTCSKLQGDRSSLPGARVPLAPDVSEFWSARVSGESRVFGECPCVSGECPCVW